MATRILSRSILTTKECLSSVFSRSYASLSIKSPPSTLTSLPSFSPLRLRSLVSAASNIRHLSPATATIRGFSTRQTTSSLNDSNPNWSNRPPKETILLDGCDFEHWLVVVEKPEGEPTRDEIIDSYIKTLAKVIGSEEEARMKIYSVSTRHYFAFGALVSEELSYKLKELEHVRWVLPDSYLDVKNKDYGGEPFINGQAVPYDPKYHEEWVRNNARANERNRRNDRPRNFDRSRNFERRRENMQQNRMGNQGPGGPPGNMGPLPNMGGPPGNMGPPPNMGGPPGNMGPPPNMGGPPRNMGPPPNMGGPPGNMGPPPNMGGPPGNMGPLPNMGGPPGNMGPPPNMGGPPGYMGPPPNMGGQPGNMGGMPYNNTGGPPPNYMGGPPPSNVGMPPNMRGVPPSNGPNFQQRDVPNDGGLPYQSNPGPNREYQNSHAPNTAGGNPYQTQDMPGRDFPPPNYQ